MGCAISFAPPAPGRFAVGSFRRALIAPDQASALECFLGSIMVQGQGFELLRFGVRFASFVALVFRCCSPIALCELRARSSLFWVLVVSGILRYFDAYAVLGPLLSLASRSRLAPCRFFLLTAHADDMSVRGM